MGHQIHAGDLDVCFTDGAWQVIHWCEAFTPRERPTGMSLTQWIDQTVGVSEATADAVKTADARVPRGYAQAKAAGLAAAASRGLAISGSW